MSTAARAPAPWQAGLQGARANLGPGFVLQLFALALVLGYYFVPAAHAALNDLSAFRERLGVIYSLASTALFGGLIPWCYLRLMPRTRSRYDARQAVGLILFWAYKGVEVHLLYEGLAHWVGADNNAATVVIKVLLDQLIYCPLLAVPGMWWGYQLVEHRGDFAGVWRRFRTRGWFYHELLPVLIANAGVWVPTVTIIYTLPTPLQLPLENLVLCFFTLMLAHLAQKRGEPVPAPGVTA